MTLPRLHPSSRYHEDDSEESRSSAIETPRRCRFLAVLLSGLLLVLPLCFGGMPEPVFLTFQIIVFVACAVWLIACRGLPTAPLQRHARMMAAALFLFIAYCAAQHVLLGYHATPHPVLGTADARPASGAFWPALRGVLFFTAIFSITLMLLQRAPASARSLTKALLASGFIVGLVALSHWFYDTGYLFWVFPPSTVTVSPRARWPFVNPNHLAGYLLPLLFVYLSTLLQRASALTDAHRKRGSRQSSKLGALFASRTFHDNAAPLLLSAAGLLTISLAFAGALSRASWLGLAAGTAAALLLQQLRAVYFAERPRRRGGAALQQEEVPRSEKIQPLRRHGAPQARQGQRRMRRFSAHAARAALFALPLALFLFFLSGRGADLVESRLEYGLLHSKDDIRWTMYHDSWGMLEAHPFFGTGLGSWAAVYPQYMDPALSGLTPVYLHSEPLQLLVECGIMGSALLAIALAALLGAALRLAGKRSGQAGLGIACGLLAFGVASAFDFPLRIPAISAQIAVLCALLLHHSANTTDAERLRR